MKNRTNIAFALGLSLVGFGCFQAVNAAGEQVMFAQAPPSPECQSLGPVAGSGYGVNFQAAQSAKNDIRNHAAAMGANFVQLDDSNIAPNSARDMIAHGVAYKCPPNAVPMAPPAPAPQPVTPAH